MSLKPIKTISKIRNILVINEARDSTLKIRFIEFSITRENVPRMIFSKEN